MDKEVYPGIHLGQLEFANVMKPLMLLTEQLNVSIRWFDNDVSTENFQCMHVT